MSYTATVNATWNRWRAFPWALWLRQVVAISRLEVKKCLVGRRLIGVYILALMPMVLLGIKAMVPPHPREVGNLGLTSMIYATLFQVYIVRLAIFFGCVGIFTNLFRGEVLEKTLHYYLLAPVRREVLVVGKYVSGLIAACVVFGVCTATTFVLAFVPHGSAALQEYVWRGPGLDQMTSYLAVTFLGCLGYGAVFLMMGLLFRNPMLLAAAVLGWESINFLLPSFLQKISVIHYLQSLCPVGLPQGPLAIIAEPTSPWISVPGLLGVTALVLIAASLKIRGVQISYGSD